MSLTDRQTIAAIGFPIIIMLLVPIRVWLVPRLPFTKEELDVLDGPVASAFVSTKSFATLLDSQACIGSKLIVQTLESVGGSM